MEYLYDKDISTKKIIIKISIPDDFKVIYLHDFLDETVPIFGYALKGIYEQYQDEYFFHQPIIEMKMGSFDLSMIVRMCEISKFNEQDGKCATRAD